GPVAALVWDFNGDSLGDLVVANNQSGAFSVFLGTADGPSLVNLFARPDALHPTALWLSAMGGYVGLCGRVVGEGGAVVGTARRRESSILRTASATPVRAAEGLPPTLADVFVVNGPGFATGLDLVAPRSEGVGVAAAEAPRLPLLATDGEPVAAAQLPGEAED